MKIYNRYLLCLAITTSLVNILLAFGGQESLEVYFIADSIVYLGITLLSVGFSPRARMALDIIGCMLFSGIVFIMVVRTIHNLSGR